MQNRKINWMIYVLFNWATEILLYKGMKRRAKLIDLRKALRPANKCNYVFTFIYYVYSTYPSGRMDDNDLKMSRSCLVANPL